MKTISKPKALAFLAIFLSLILSPGCQSTDTANPPSPHVWCGLDYSMVKMIGTTGFRRPEKIFPDMFNAWNKLFMQELFPKLASTGSPWSKVKVDTNAIYSCNAKTSPSQMLLEDGTRDEMVKATDITEVDIAKEVKSYDLKYDQGVGLVFIIDRLVKLQHTECIYVVFFDISSRKVLYSERVIASANGVSFRNYWFNPIKTAVGDLPWMYKKAEKARKAILE